MSWDFGVMEKLVKHIPHDQTALHLQAQGCKFHMHQSMHETP